jgi:hypothetical protein
MLESTFDFTLNEELFSFRMSEINALRTLCDLRRSRVIIKRNVKTTSRKTLLLFRAGFSHRVVTMEFVANSVEVREVLGAFEK